MKKFLYAVYILWIKYNIFQLLIIFLGNIEQSSSSPKIQKQEENNDQVNDNFKEAAKEQTITAEEPKKN